MGGTSSLSDSELLSLPDSSFLDAFFLVGSSPVLRFVPAAAPATFVIVMEGLLKTERETVERGSALLIVGRT